MNGNIMFKIGGKNETKYREVAQEYMTNVCRVFEILLLATFQFFLQGMK